MKSKINLIIDAIMLILMSVIAGLGLLMKYVLIPGFKRNEIYGKNIELFYLGYDRHWWGNLHFILNIILVSLVVLHIILHWKMILTIFKKIFKNKALRLTTEMILLILSIFLIGSTLFVKPKIEDEITAYSNKITRQEQTKTTVLQNILPKESIKGNQTKLSQTKHLHGTEEDIKGSMSLNKIAEKYNISADMIKRKLNIPISVSNDSKAG